MAANEFSHQLIQLEGKLSHFAMSLTSNKDDAEDLLQDTMLKAYTYQNQFAESTNLLSWTFTIMKNTFINNYRRNKGKHTVFDNSKELFLLNGPIENNNSTPDSVYSEKELILLVDRLSNEFKTPFKMHVEGYKYREIAEKLQMKIGTVKSRIFFARHQLMEELCELN